MKSCNVLSAVFALVPAVVIAQGAPDPEAYHAHPTTALLGDHNTMFCVWNIGHGGHAGPMARSDVGGFTWSGPVIACDGAQLGGKLPCEPYVFRNASPSSRDKAGFIAWVGTYDDIRQGRPGQYRVSLLKTWKDGFYPGIHLLPDGTIVATTYANYRAEDVGCSIVSVRLKIDEIDALAAKRSPHLSNEVNSYLLHRCQCAPAQRKELTF